MCDLNTGGKISSLYLLFLHNKQRKSDLYLHMHQERLII